MYGKPEDGSKKAGSVDPEALSQNLARWVEEGGRALAAYLKPREEGELRKELAEDINDVVKTFGQVAEYWLADPKRTLEAQSRLMQGYLDVWASTMKRMAGEKAEPVATPNPKDARFSDPEWSQNLFFDALKQAYLVTADWAGHMVRDAQSLDEHTRQKADFYVRQIAGAISPSNFVFTNPELLRETLSQNAENLVRGMKMLTEDIQAGHGDLKIRQTDASKFELGRTLATTPGKVVFENELIQLIQYAPTTESVLQVPLLVVPPWINKYYVLDLTPDKSLLKWMVDQGLTVFVVSWVNPDARLAGKGFEEYMREGIIAALDAMRAATGEDKAHVVGYCVGGTLAAVTLAYLAAQGDDRVLSASFLATQVDFTFAGDLKVFVDEEQIAALERRMKEVGFLEAGKMSAAFNMLRAGDLIWPYIVNNYLRGKAPFPFDLLFWNSDSTRLPAANHSFYMRNCYLDNKLSKGEMEIAGVKLDLHKIKMPIYDLATREDHIAPAKSVFVGAQFFGGPVRFVLSGSGHIAGVVNPPDKHKYQYWTGGKTKADLETWIKEAEEHAGSWWTDWFEWIKSHDARRVPARTPGGGKLPPIEDAPGRYVKVRA
ncbi:MAG: class I poly(R)-hydroxyalkanoic acid synthase [Xanthobacteraceae bacterium]|nr:class I poly(R)-hydroxyalkanoic acid synthase [Xanthobacteraceae bacterium]